MTTATPPENPYLDLYHAAPSFPPSFWGSVHGEATRASLPALGHLAELFEGEGATDEDEFMVGLVRAYEAERAEPWTGGVDPMVLTAHLRIRDILTQAYAWAVPGEEALETLVALGPLLEIGAGTGYWASLLRARGADVLATDLRPRVTRHSEVVRAEAAEAAAAHPDRALLLVWPERGGPMAARALNAYAGDTVAYVGEYGVTADADFYLALDREWTLSTVVPVPRWMALRDSLLVYRR